MFENFAFPDLNDPKTVGLLQMAAGLMQGRKGRGLLGNVGNAAQQGLLGFQGATEQGYKRKLLDSQISENESQAAARKAKTEQDAAFNQQLSGVFSRMQGSPGVQMPPAMDLVNTFRQEQSQPMLPGRSIAPQSPQFPSFAELAQLKAKGVDLLPIVEKAVTGFGLDSGKLYRDQQGNERYITKLPEGMGQQNNVAGFMPGYLDSMYAAEAEKTDAQERGKLPFDIARIQGRASVAPFKVEGQGGSYLTNELAAASGGQIPPMFQPPQIQPSGPQGAAGFPRVAPQVQAGRDQGVLQILQQELDAERAKAPHPQQQANINALNNEIQRVGGKVPQTTGTQIPGTPLKSEAEKLREKATIEIQEDIAKKAAAEALSQQGLLRTVKTIRGIIGNPNSPDVYGASIPDRAALALNPIGLNETPKAVNTNRIRELGNQLVLARGSLGAGVSVADAERYEKAAGAFTRAKTVADMISALNIMEEIALKAIAFSEAQTKSLQTGQPFQETPSFVFDPATGKIRKQ